VFHPLPLHGRFIRVRSPLLTELLLLSFPPDTEMFQFSGFALHPYAFRMKYPLRDGLPHSDIPRSLPGYRLPWTFRRFPRLSSPLDAKTSTMCPCLDHTNQASCPCGHLRPADARLPLLSPG